MIRPHKKKGCKLFIGKSAFNVIFSGRTCAVAACGLDCSTDCDDIVVFLGKFLVSRFSRRLRYNFQLGNHCNSLETFAKPMNCLISKESANIMLKTLVTPTLLLEVPGEVLSIQLRSVCRIFCPKAAESYISNFGF